MASEEQTGNKAARVDQPVIDALRAERVAIEHARRSGRANVTRAWIMLALAVGLSTSLWLGIGGAGVAACASLWTVKPKPFDAAMFVGLAGITLIFCAMNVVRLVHAHGRQRVSARWTRGVPFDCPRCRYRLRGPTARCPECGWHAGG